MHKNEGNWTLKDGDAGQKFYYVDPPLNEPVDGPGILFIWRDELVVLSREDEPLHFMQVKPFLSGNQFRDFHWKFNKL